MDLSSQANLLANSHVHIMGLGWLGLPLSRALHQLDVHVSGSVRSEQKQSNLQQTSLSVDTFDLYKPLDAQPTNAKKPLSTRFIDASLVINIPPGRKDFKRELFVSHMLKLVNYAMQNGLKQLIFISTTSVFDNTCEVINNCTPLSPQTESGKAHQAIEEYLALHYPSTSKILRPSGLVGPTLSSTNFSLEDSHYLSEKKSQCIENNAVTMRHPILTLCHKNNIPNGNDPVNLVHQVDVITAIVALLSSRFSSIHRYASHAFNLAAIEHPSRQAYYQWCAEQLSLPTPHFLPDTKKRQLGKLIDASDTFTELGFTPVYATPYAML